MQNKTNSFFVPAERFPSNMAQTLKPGEVIEFKVVSGMDDQGEIELEYNTGEPDQAAMPGSDEKEESWEDEARSAIGPQAPENEA